MGKTGVGFVRTGKRKLFSNHLHRSFEEGATVNKKV